MTGGLITGGFGLASGGAKYIPALGLVPGAEAPPETLEDEGNLVEFTDPGVLVVLRGDALL